MLKIIPQEEGRKECYIGAKFVYGIEINIFKVSIPMLGS